MRVHVVEYDSCEGAGAILARATERGHRLAVSRLHAGDRLPSADGVDVLVVMGGPQSVRTTVQQCPYFDSVAEQRLVRDCVDAGAAVVGVCLGAQHRLVDRPGDGR